MLRSFDLYKEEKVGGDLPAHFFLGRHNSDKEGGEGAGLKSGS